MKSMFSYSFFAPKCANGGGGGGTRYYLSPKFIGNFNFEFLNIFLNCFSLGAFHSIWFMEVELGKLE